MSFSSRVKDEISKTEILKTESISELSAIVRNNAKITNEIDLSFENAAITKRIYLLFKEVCLAHAIIIPIESKTHHQKHIYQIIINKEVEKVLDILGIKKENKNIVVAPPTYLISDEDEKKAYLRGVFLATGSISDPKTSNYHLEFMITDLKHAKTISKLLNDFYLNSKILERDNGYMIYLKEAEQISDFLRIIGASSAVLYFEDIRIYRDHKNMTNRFNNCEQANVNKTISAAKEQLEDIIVLENRIGLDLLKKPLQEAAFLRKKYPEASLKELSYLSENGISKSGLNHRFRKIKELAQNKTEN